MDFWYGEVIDFLQKIWRFWLLMLEFEGYWGFEVGGDSWFGVGGVPLVFLIQDGGDPNLNACYS